jgi:predicted RNA-binding protein
MSIFSLILSLRQEDEGAMCQATVYLGKREVAQEISALEPAEGGVRLESLFGGSRFVAGRIKSIDFLKHRVLLEPFQEASDERP